MFDKSIFFFFKAIIFGVAAYAVIPRHVFKKYFLYAFIFGAIADVLIVSTLHSLNLVSYYNMGPFGIFGVFTFWTPIAWMFTFMLFFYFLPVRTAFLIPYIIGFSLFGYMVGLVLTALGLFEYIGIYKYYAPVVFIAWFSLAAYAYIKIGNIKLRALS